MDRKQPYYLVFLADITDKLRQKTTIKKANKLTVSKQLRRKKIIADIVTERNNFACKWYFLGINSLLQKLHSQTSKCFI